MALDTNDTVATDTAVDAPPRSGLSLRMFLALVLTPFLLAGGIIAVASLTRGAGPAAPTGLTYTFEIPEGTAARMERGEPVADVFPERMAASVGDTYIVVNRDDATHQLGPIVVRGGETAEITFYQAGTYVGACTVGDHDTVTIVVT